LIQLIWQKFITFWRSLFGAIAFYTCVPIPYSWTNFEAIARFAPVVGLLIGGLLALLDQGLSWLEMPIFTRSVLIILVGIFITGGLHLDGVLDSADGLAVQDENKRLQVMTDSNAGAFAVMAGVCLILLKTASLTDLDQQRWLILILAAMWGRWGQIVAIALYPYLKPTGKGAFHKEAIKTLDIYLGLGLILTINIMYFWLLNQHIIPLLLLNSGGIAIAILTGKWFNQKLGGHTGDTYGAVVEWTEALFLCWSLVIGH
jgi:adenosylcobinamide-GDP ribazoletransferase